MGDSKPVRFVDRTTGSVEQASFGDKAIIDVATAPAEPPLHDVDHLIHLVPVTNCHRFVTLRAKAWQLSPATSPPACFHKSRLME